MKKVLLTINIVFFISISGFSQFGTQDPTFGIGGLVLTNFDTSLDVAVDVFIQPDQKIIAVGETRNVISDITSIGLVRYLPDGNVDTTFNSTGKVKTPVTSFAPSYAIGTSIYYYSNKITVAGYFTPLESDLGQKDIVIVRYNYDGSLDTSFSSDGMVTFDVDYNDWISSVVVDPVTYKVVVAFFSSDSLNNSTKATIVRLNNNGSIDNSFANNGMLTIQSAIVFKVALQADRKILLTGSTNLVPEAAVWRLNEMDGSFDNTFAVNGFFNLPVYQDGHSIEIRSDGVIIILGEQGSLAFLAALNPNGTLNNTFGSGGLVLTNIPSHNNRIDALALQPDNKIIVTGQGNGVTDFITARFSSNGVLDNSFGTGGIVTTDFNAGTEDLSYTCALQADGKIVVAGYSDAGIGYDFALCRYITGVPSGLMDLSKSSASIEIVPNPAQDILLISFPDAEFEKHELTVCDIMGNNIFVSTIMENGKLTVDVHSLPNGIYFAKIWNGKNNLEVRKFVKI